uniref:KRAB domain-containing protein n=1 Tax=Macrostomum lignano TaxID=282301 RepID=A0A1I8FCP0_9PLAT
RRRKGHSQGASPRGPSPPGGGAQNTVVDLLRALFKGPFEWTENAEAVINCISGDSQADSADQCLPAGKERVPGADCSACSSQSNWHAIPGFPCQAAATASQSKPSCCS